MGTDAFVQTAVIIWGVIIPLLVTVNRRRWNMPGMDVAFLLVIVLIFLVFVAMALGPEA